jgi:hypothetical protein
MVEDYSGKFIRTKTSIELEEVLNFLDDDIRKMNKTHLWMYHLRNALKAPSSLMVYKKLMRSLSFFERIRMKKSMMDSITEIDEIISSQEEILRRLKREYSPKVDE